LTHDFLFYSQLLRTVASFSAPTIAGLAAAADSGSRRREHPRPIELQSKQSAIRLLEIEPLQLEQILFWSIDAGDSGHGGLESSRLDDALGIATEVRGFAERVGKMSHGNLKAIFHCLLGSEDFVV
jgi:hypothetical protein